MMEIAMNTLMNFIRDEEGLTVIEYVIGASLLVIGLIAVFANYGNLLSLKLNSILNNIT